MDPNINNRYIEISLRSHQSLPTLGHSKQKLHYKQMHLLLMVMLPLLQFMNTYYYKGILQWGYTNICIIYSQTMYIRNDTIILMVIHGMTE